MSGLRFSLQPHFISFPLCSELSSHSGIFLFFGLMRMLFSLWDLCTYCPCFPARSFLALHMADSISSIIPWLWLSAWEIFHWLSYITSSFSLLYPISPIFTSLMTLIELEIVLFICLLTIFWFSQLGWIGTFVCLVSLIRRTVPGLL